MLGLNLSLLMALRSSGLSVSLGEILANATGTITTLDAQFRPAAEAEATDGALAVYTIGTDGVVTAVLTPYAALPTEVTMASQATYVAANGQIVTISATIVGTADVVLELQAGNLPTTGTDITDAGVLAFQDADGAVNFDVDTGVTFNVLAGNGTEKRLVNATGAGETATGELLFVSLSDSGFIYVGPSGTPGEFIARVAAGGVDVSASVSVSGSPGSFFRFAAGISETDGAGWLRIFDSNGLYAQDTIDLSSYVAPNVSSLQVFNGATRVPSTTIPAINIALVGCIRVQSDGTTTAVVDTAKPLIIVAADDLSISALDTLAGTVPAASDAVVISGWQAAVTAEAPTVGVEMSIDADTLTTGGIGNYTYTVSQGAVSDPNVTLTPSAGVQGWNLTATDARGYTATANASFTPANVPAAFTSGMWTLTIPVEASRDRQLLITTNDVPSGNGSPLTGVEYRVDGGTWTPLPGPSGGVTTGARTIPIGAGTQETGGGPIVGTAVDVELRAVSAIGNGPASDTKSLAPEFGPNLLTTDAIQQNAAVTITNGSPNQVRYDFASTGARHVGWDYTMTASTVYRLSVMVRYDLLPAGTFGAGFFVSDQADQSGSFVDATVVGVPSAGRTSANGQFWHDKEYTADGNERSLGFCVFGPGASGTFGGDDVILRLAPTAILPSTSAVLTESTHYEITDPKMDGERIAITITSQLATDFPDADEIQYRIDGGTPVALANGVTAGTRLITTTADTEIDVEIRLMDGGVELAGWTTAQTITPTDLIGNGDTTGPVGAFETETLASTTTRGTTVTQAGDTLRGAVWSFSQELGKVYRLKAAITEDGTTPPTGAIGLRFAASPNRSLSPSSSWEAAATEVDISAAGDTGVQTYEWTATTTGTVWVGFRTGSGNETNSRLNISGARIAVKPNDGAAGDATLTASPSNPATLSLNKTVDRVAIAKPTGVTYTHSLEAMRAGLNTTTTNAHVYEVTSTADTNTQGTLRHAVTNAGSGSTSGPRIVHFTVDGGTITLGSDLTVTRDNVWIAGQTAPKMIRIDSTSNGRQFLVSASNVVIEHLEFIKGAPSSTSASSNNLFRVETNGASRSNILVRNCTFALGTDQDPNIIGSNINHTMTNVGFVDCIVGPMISGVGGNYHEDNHHFGTLFAKNAINVSLMGCAHLGCKDRHPIIAEGCDALISHIINVDYQNGDDTSEQWPNYNTLVNILKSNQGWIETASIDEPVYPDAPVNVTVVSCYGVPGGQINSLVAESTSYPIRSFQVDNGPVEVWTRFNRIDTTGITLFNNLPSGKSLPAFGPNGELDDFSGTPPANYLTSISGKTFTSLRFPRDSSNILQPAEPPPVWCEDFPPAHIDWVISNKLDGKGCRPSNRSPMMADAVTDAINNVIDQGTLASRATLHKTANPGNKDTLNDTSAGAFSVPASPFVAAANGKTNVENSLRTRAETLGADSWGSVGRDLTTYLGGKLTVTSAGEVTWSVTAAEQSIIGSSTVAATVYYTDGTTASTLTLGADT